MGASGVSVRSVFVLQPAHARVWRVRAFVFRELDFSWKNKQAGNNHARYRYRDDELERIRRGLKGFADRVWEFSGGSLRIQWDLNVIDEPLRKLDGEDSFWPGPDSCMPFFKDLRPGQVDTIMVFAKAWIAWRQRILSIE